MVRTKYQYPGDECIEKIVMLKKEIQKNHYTLPIYLIFKFSDGIARSFVLENKDQIRVVMENKENPCGKKICPIAELLSKEKNITIDPHEECSLKVSNDAKGKPVFLTALN